MWDELSIALVGLIKNMQLNRTNFLKVLLQSEPGNLALANGLRGALALGVPMLFSQVTDYRKTGLFVALIAYFVNQANVGGPYRIKATTMTTATLGIAVSVFVGTLAAGIHWLAVVLTFIWGLGSGFASLYGTAGTTVGLVIGISFVSAIAESGDLFTAVSRFSLCLLAGVWAMFLSLVTWAATPYKPLQASVAECYSSLCDYIQTVLHNTIQTGSDASQPEYLLKIRKALENARAALGQERLTKPSRSWIDEQLLVLIQDAERLFGSVIALNELISINSQYQQFQQVQLLVDDVLQELAVITKVIAQVITGKPTVISLGNLNRIYEALREQENIAIENHQTNHPGLVAVSNLVLLIEKLIKQLYYTGLTAQYLRANIKTRKRDSSTVFAVEEKQQSPLRKLRDNLTLNSAIFRHALRLGVTLTMGVAVAKFAGLEMGYWVTLTIIIVLKPDFGGTFQRFFQRIVGTILGAIVAAILVAVIANKAVLDVFTLLAAFFGVSLLRYNYGYAVFFFSIFVLLIIDLAQPITWQFASIRVVNTLIGAGLAFAGHYLMWPSWERQRLPNQLAAAIRQCSNYFQKVMAVYQGQTENQATIINQRRLTGLAITNAQASYQGLLGEPKTPLGVVEPFMAMFVYMGRFTNAVTVLAVHLDYFKRTEPLPELETFTQQISVILDQLADSAQQGISPPPLPNLDETLEKIHPCLQTLRSDRLPEVENQGVRDYTIIDMEIDQIVRRVNAMHSALERLNTELHFNAQNSSR
ncbi:FUSC family protein [Aetokthonos hydrillicola]|nr:FUSC family protein [Aetokthonos hydrillicola]